jgi:uncharacterized protein (TIGR02001 family)
MEKHMKLNKTHLLAAAFATLGYTQFASAELSTNIGLVSEYHFRGIAQTSDASASAGIDYEANGFYVGAWTADVSDGLEIDLYAGYGFDLGDSTSASIGVTTYQYTGDFDTAYNELNLGLTWGPVSFEYSIGKRDDDVALGVLTEEDYTFFGVTVEKNGFYGTFGTFGDDYEGEYFEAGWGTEVGGFDVGVSAVFSGNDLDDDETLLFSVSKSFAI